MMGVGGLNPDGLEAPEVPVGAAVPLGDEAMVTSVRDPESESDSNRTSSSGWTEVKLKIPEPVGDGSLFEMVGCRRVLSSCFCRRVL